jgi:hypothetical protein
MAGDLMMFIHIHPDGSAVVVTVEPAELFVLFSQGMLIPIKLPRPATTVGDWRPRPPESPEG